MEVVVTTELLEL